jgi:hypothetical protein
MVKNNVDPRIDAKEVERLKAERAEAERSKNKITYKTYNAKELDELDTRLEYLVQGVLVRGQHGMFVAPQKTMKTTTCIDLALSLATGSSFLEKFSCQQSKVLMMTGESGLSVVQETSRRIAQSKDLTLSNIADQFIVSDQIPLLYSIEHQYALAGLLDDIQPDLLIADPVYMMVDGTDAGNLFTMGAQLKPTAVLCAERGITILLVHHSTKSSSNVKEYLPLGLGDIAWSGFAEFARQWVFLNRREEYELGTGEHQLWLSYGGSAGHSGCWAVEVNEGPNDAIEGREYSVTVTDMADAVKSRIEETESAQEARRQEKELRALKRSADEVLTAFVGVRDALTQNQIETKTGMRTANAKRAVAYLVRIGILEASTVTRNKREFDGYIRTEKPYEN